MNYGGKKYDTQFTSTGKKKKYFMHDMHKLSVGVTFTHITSKKGFKKHGEIAVAVVYREYTPLQYMKVMGSLDPDSLTISQKKGSMREIKLIIGGISQTSKSQFLANYCM